MRDARDELVTAISPEELALRAGNGHGAVAPAELERWLIRERLAKRTVDGLVPTELTIELADTLEEVARGDP